MAKIEVKIEAARAITSTRVRKFLRNMPSVSRMEMFELQRASLADLILLAVHLDRDVGIATLGRGGEFGEMTPKVLGIWVIPALRRHKVGTRLMVELAGQSVTRYGAPALVTPYTRDGIALCGHVQGQRNVVLKVSHTSALHELP